MIYEYVNFAISGLIDEIAEVEDVANSVNDSDGVYFVPAFSGLHVRSIFPRSCNILHQFNSIWLRKLFIVRFSQAPINDYTAAAGFIGMKPTTERSHVVRSMLESIVYGIILVFEVLDQETNQVYDKIR